MEILFYSLLFLSTINLIAQPTIGPGVIVDLDEEEPTIFLAIQEQNWNNGMSGQNINWDYSALILNHSYYSLAFMK